MTREAPATPKLVLPNDRPPLFVGAGVIKSAEQIETYAAIPEIAVQVMGSYSYEENPLSPDEANLQLVWWDEANQAFYNAMRLKNIGRKAAEQFLPDSIKRIQAAGQVAILGITPLHGEDPRKVIPDLVEWAVELGADGVEINGACPNEGTHEVMCNDVFLTVNTVDMARKRVGNTPYLLLKVAPLPKEQIRLYKVMLPKVDGLSVMNNCRRLSPQNEQGGRRIQVNDGYAGESGPIVAGLGRTQLRMWQDRSVGSPDFQPDIWSIGGIDNGIEAFLRVQLLGAFAAGGAQAFYRSKEPSVTAQRWAKEYRRAAADRARISGNL